MYSIEIDKLHTYISYKTRYTRPIPSHIMPKDAKSKSEWINDLKAFAASGKKSLGSAAPRANHSLYGDYVAM